MQIARRGGPGAELPGNWSDPAAQPHGRQWARDARVPMNWAMAGD